MPAKLIKPDTRVHQSFLEAMAEFAAEGRGSASDNSMVGTDIRNAGPEWAEPARFAEYVSAVVRDAAEDAPRAPNRVPSTTLWWVDGDIYLGRIAIRHRLNDVLLQVGGHIGYDVRASARRRGHATEMLRAALPIAHDLGIDPALITCDTDNVGSRKVIESAGGAFEDVRDDKRRYWVPTGDAKSVDLTAHRHHR